MKNFPKLQFDPNYKRVYTYWKCPECQLKFDGLCPPRHQSACSRSEQGYIGLILFIGPNGVEAIKRRVAQSTLRYPETECHPILRVSLMMLRKQLPQVLKEKTQHSLHQRHR